MITGIPELSVDKNLLIKGKNFRSLLRESPVKKRKWWCSTTCWTTPSTTTLVTTFAQPFSKSWQAIWSRKSSWYWRSCIAVTKEPPTSLVSCSTPDSHKLATLQEQTERTGSAQKSIIAAPVCKNCSWNLCNWYWHTKKTGSNDWQN